MIPNSKRLKPESRILELLFKEGYVVGFVTRGEKVEHFLADFNDRGFIDRLGSRGFIKEVRKVLVSGDVPQEFKGMLGAENVEQLPHELILFKILEELNFLLSGEQ
ncbi:MAG: hypothetical protein ACP5I2_04500 [Fervidicoccaceae archaeon]|uniref:Uncharacterized protein n=1 Tax=Fervidicoccus fontis TaxID=683846 RepID=A0A7C2ULZ7_9CREN|nr:MAG: hypothetical protein C0179_01865 [Fervidicoccus sp.]HEU98209.1 hypothetical protein [Fervidicoccus fontis]